MDSMARLEFGTLDMSLASQHKYGVAEIAGAQWQRWQTDADDDTCKVKEARITISLLRGCYKWAVRELYSHVTQDYYVDPPPSRTVGILAECDLPTGKVYKSIRLSKKLRLRDPRHSIRVNDYFMLVGPGVLFAVNSKRKNGPYWSEVALAVYRHYETVELRHVFRLDVINRATRSVVIDVYRKNDLKWPDYQRSHWKFNTPEHRAIMSTPNGSGVAALVLGGFERGTRYISEIITWADTDYSNLQMQFVLSDRSPL